MEAVKKLTAVLDGIEHRGDNLLFVNDRCVEVFAYFDGQLVFTDPAA